jgi:hypothetical protein
MADKRLNASYARKTRLTVVCFTLYLTPLVVHVFAQEPTPVVTPKSVTVKITEQEGLGGEEFLILEAASEEDELEEPDAKRVKC